MTLESVVVKAQTGDSAALCELVDIIKDDIYRLSMRMLGGREDAEDATQEILINVLKGIKTFRAESSFRTWVWRIATNHISRARRAVREKTCSFDALDAVLEMGEQGPLVSEQPPGQELLALANEVRLSCTTAMLLALDREYRIAFVLGVVFELDGSIASEILGVTPATFRKRLERARRKLDKWMQRQCGLVNASAGCSCIRQVAIATENNHIDPSKLMYSDHPVTDSQSDSLTSAELRKASDEVLGYARVLIDHPEYAAPAVVSKNLKYMIENRDLQIFQ
ncbi:RNA polymerase sigma factor [Gammaproteobacteria bacterium]|nr:RNA polymerase sigma factor [Gammaproteobacteria bacterium]